MTENTEQTPIDPTDEGRNPILEAARNVLMAGIGAVSLAQEEMEDFVNRLIERGEIAEKDGRKLMEDINQRRKSRMKKVEDRFETRINRILERLDIPTRADVDRLNERIAELNRKIDRLKTES